MTHLSSPAAESAVGLSQINTMSDVIDSLKRLERIGSENSKTVEKIIAAAREAEAKIIEQYLKRSDGVVIDPASILGRAAEGKSSSFEETARALRVRCREQHEVDEFPSYSGLPARYTISENSNGRRLYRANSSEWVGENRDTALAFAKDLSNGLLAVIAEDLSQQRRENEEALRMLQQARQSFDTKPQSPIERAVRIQTPSRNFVAKVALTFELLDGDLPDRMLGRFIDFGDDPVNELAVRDEGVTMWLGQNGYRVTMVGKSGSADFSIEHQRINPVTGLRGFTQE